MWLVYKAIGSGNHGVHGWNRSQEPSFVVKPLDEVTFTHAGDWSPKFDQSDLWRVQKRGVPPTIWVCPGYCLPVMRLRRGPRMAMVCVSCDMILSEFSFTLLALSRLHVESFLVAFVALGHRTQHRLSPMRVSPFGLGGAAQGQPEGVDGCRTIDLTKDDWD